MVSGILSKVPLRVQRIFLKKTVLWNLLYKELVAKFEQKTFGRMVNMPLRFNETWNSDGRLYLLGKIKLFLFFPHIMWKFFATSNEVGRVIKSAFTLSSETFWRQSSLNEKIFRFSLCLDLEQKLLGRVVTSASQASRGTFWRRTEFWKDLNFFEFGWMTSGRVQNWYLRVQKNVSSDFILKNQSFVFILGFEQNFCDNFSKMLPANFSELNSMCAEEQTEKKNSYGEFRYQSFFPDFERWLNVTFGKKRFRGACQKCLLRVQRNFLQKTTLWKLSYSWLVSELEGKPCGTIFKLFLRVQWNSVRKLYFMGKIKNIIVSIYYVKLYRNFKRYW